MIEQFSPIGVRSAEDRSLIRPVSQINIRLISQPGKNRFEATVDHVLHWMKKRSGRALPLEAWERKPFELLDIGAQRAAAVTLAMPRYWAGRLDDDDKHVPRRDWITEIGIALDDDNDVIFGARLICSTRGDDVPFDRSIPGVVKQAIGFGRVLPHFSGRFG